LQKIHPLDFSKNKCLDETLMEKPLSSDTLKVFKNPFSIYADTN